MMTRLLLVALGGVIGLLLLRRQMFGDPAPLVSDGWREMERVDSV